MVAYKNGAPVRLKDVATLVSGAENAKLGGWMNSVPALILNVQRQPGANVVDVVNRIHDSAALAAGRAARGRGSRHTHRPHDDHPGLGRPTSSSSWCSPSCWWCW